MTCQSEHTNGVYAEDLMMEIWQSNLHNVTKATVTMAAKPYTEYTCSMAAFNAYGVGIPGSKSFVVTPESCESVASLSGILVL